MNIGLPTDLVGPALALTIWWVETTLLEKLGGSRPTLL